MNDSLPLQFQHSLKNLGFSSNEAIILGYLFQCKKADSKTIVKNTGLSSAAVQFGLTSLHRRNLLKLVPESEEYEICDQPTFASWIRDQKKINERLYEQAEQDLDGFFDFIEENTWNVYFEDEAIASIYEDMLETEEDVYGWADCAQIINIIDRYIPDWKQRKSSKGISSHGIMPDDKVNRDYISQKGAQREGRFLKDFECPGQVRIYGDRVSITTISEQDQKPIGIILKGTHFAKLFKGIFDAQWKLMEDAPSDTDLS